MQYKQITPTKPGVLKGIVGYEGDEAGKLVREVRIHVDDRKEIREMSGVK